MLGWIWAEKARTLVSEVGEENGVRKFALRESVEMRASELGEDEHA